MKNFFCLLGILIVFSARSPAVASNACSAPTIVTSADVMTSYGAEYQVNTYYRSSKEAVTAFVSDRATRMAVEGGLAWSDQEDGAVLADDSVRRFVIGHQFHALAFQFDEIATDIIQVTGVAFGDDFLDGRKGDYPFGGTMTLLKSSSERPFGLILNLPKESEITVSFDDWRVTDEGNELPYSLIVTHEGNEFYYTYTDVSILTGDSAKDAIDFQEAYPAPDIDEVKVHRLHRALLAAHCRGDAGAMEALTASEATIANRGEITRTTAKDVGAQFSSLFSSIDYTGYHDLEDPIITVAESEDIGWIIVNPLAEGREIQSGETFRLQWAWIMLVRKIDGVWLHAGNASNLKTQ